jgi:hypothetical protein
VELTDLDLDSVIFIKVIGEKGLGEGSMQTGA